ncbi:putative lysyl-trna synthetase [Phaeomoniella chlamydospora]|uniref:Putative lysyl-trna synthetase n=1 Tax=Phaeomoniella chlamydospora TaxID=158046 RepID=A0A0G2GGN8_PHACM|nr:putative lysyl-trna synthetase [Phaeomoniella chlamydospora]
MDKALFKDKCNDLSRGDVISVRGYAHRTERGELSIKAVDIPKLLSPCLQPFPIQEFDRPEKDKQALLDADRHVQLLSTKNVMETIRCRSTIIRSLRNFLSRRSFIEVDTPILGAVASGATARPFETKATEFLDRRLALRIAPELWLKRLILGGFEKVFEIGPSFRNEGLDKTHNPEFTTCEFYTTHTSLNDLMSMTEALLHYIHLQVSQEHTSSLATTLPVLSKDQFSGSFPRLPFIPTLENALGLYLPPLHSPDTLSTENALKQIFHQKSLPLPQLPTIPRLLDKLSAIYLEPRCIDRPTFITHHPECLSPLSKSYLDPITHQKLSARAELFINGREIANMYEEENSPFEQKKKFDMQNTFTARAKQLVAADQSKSSALDQDETLESDTSYLEALEWGLPPTGGWGCGVDRLVMLFTGKEKISDVLTFGNLRSVTRVKGGR